MGKGRRWKGREGKIEKRGGSMPPRSADPGYGPGCANDAVRQAIPLIIVSHTSFGRYHVPC